MIQRIQTLYLFVVFALCLVCLCLPVAHFVALGSNAQAGGCAGVWNGCEQIDMYNLWLVSEGRRMFYFCPVLMAILVITAALTFMDIWLYRHRILQMRIIIFCMILLVAWYIAYGVIVYLMVSTVTAFESVRPHLTAALPAVSFILLYLAHRGIMKDEKLVRSLDRLR